ncbi:MAG: ribosome small subunit-dependent GTPase A [Clostridia bacterium]|nr:ribosome small subunit-dependent GTPase A [Clostridia bacterium]
MESELGVIIKEKKGLYTVSAGGEELFCKAGSRIRKDGIRLMAGDRVEVERNADGSGFIRNVTPRKNALPRPLVANIDTLVIVTATTSPAPYPYNIDKLTVMAEKADVAVAVVINKCDLKSPGELLDMYRTVGYDCFTVCAATSKGVEELRTYLKGKTAVFAGASGVGKSSLLNALYPGMEAETGELSKKIARGRNTTRHTEFFPVDKDTYIADTPGFTMLDEDKLGIEEYEELYLCFPEFEKHIGQCMFRGCTHLKEDGCAILAAVKCKELSQSRHESYVKLYGELKNRKRYG